MKLLFLDIETSPIRADVWGIWDQRVGLNQIHIPTKVLCFAAKWLGSKEIIYADIHDPKAMVSRIHGLLEEADAVCHFNGTRFDIPHLNREFILAGLNPPSPYRQVDLLQTARRKFKFVSNKLSYLTEIMGLGSKVAHEGHGLWKKVMEDDPDAWKRMQRYNEKDVILLEKLYHKMLPWIKGHPNVGMFDGEEKVCPSCGSDHYQRRGFAHTNVFAFQKYQCQKCFSWFRDAATAKPVARNKFVGVS